MEKLLWSVGIDIAKDKFDVCIKVRRQDRHVVIKGSTSFANDYPGFVAFGLWVRKRTQDKENLIFVMEATGVYYEDLAYYLYDEQAQVCVELANKVKHYAKSKNVKTKTDKVDAAVLADMGLERELTRWRPMFPQYRKLRDINRLILSYKKDLNALKSQLHAMKHAHDTSTVVMSMQEEQIAFYVQNIAKLAQHSATEVSKDKELVARINKVATIKGVTAELVVSILCETNGFALFHSMRQVVSYAGLDVKCNESGTRAGKTTISKKGNARIRQLLYMPALSAIQYNVPIKALYGRVCVKHPDMKKKGVVAAMRKLLLLIYVLWKKEEEFDVNYQWGGQKRNG